MIAIQDEIKTRLGNKIIDWYQHSSRRFYISIKSQDIREAARILFKELNLRFSIVTGQDTSKGLEILYHFSFDKTGQIFSLRVLIEDKRKPEIDSIATIFPAAEWIEREIWEMLGINFKGHPNLKRLLLSEEWPEGKYPLRHEDES
ncbi:MAG: NADH-quinone oxidoreductase subunit C [Candidatus Omnitrophica bacterium]|nr:NADH-quinone oxidoreductase subunit C [Candidatus Omnitrophota bacterium]